jgi:hypothetical protein
VTRQTSESGGQAVEAPLGQIQVGFTTQQAVAIVQEFDALWAHSNHLGKRSVNHLRTLRDTLAAQQEHGT